MSTHEETGDDAMSDGKARDRKQNQDRCFCAQEEEELLGGDQEEIAEEEQTGHTKAGRTGTTSGTQMAKFL